MPFFSAIVLGALRARDAEVGVLGEDGDGLRLAERGRQVEEDGGVVAGGGRDAEDVLVALPGDLLLGGDRVHQRNLVLLGLLGHRVGHRGGVGADHAGDVVAGGELVHGGEPHLRLAGVVLPDELHLDALGRQVLLGELDPVGEVLADGGLRTGHRVDDSDLDLGHRECGYGEERCGSRGRGCASSCRPPRRGRRGLRRVRMWASEPAEFIARRGRPKKRAPGLSDPALHDAGRQEVRTRPLEDQLGVQRELSLARRWCPSRRSWWRGSTRPRSASSSPRSR